MSPEAPFFADRRKRAGLVRRVGNLADKLTGPDPDFVAMYLLASDEAVPDGQATHLRAMMASQLEFVSPWTRAEAMLIAKRAGVTVEFVNQTNYQGDINRAPETMRTALSDVAAVAKRNLE